MKRPGEALVSVKVMVAKIMTAMWLMVAILCAGASWAQTLEIDDDLDILETKDSFTVGIVHDGPSEIYDRYEALILKELQDLTKGNATVSFKHYSNPSPAFDPNAVKQILTTAMNDPDVDMVFANGEIVTLAANKDPNLVLSKPVISSILLKSDMVDLVNANQTKLVKDNLSIVISTHPLRRDIEVFKDITNFKTLHTVVTSRLLTFYPDFENHLQQRLGNDLQIQIKLLTFQNDLDTFIQSLPEDVEALYLPPVMDMSINQRRQLVDALNQRKIPTFSYVGIQDVNNGVLATATPNLFQRMARRVAINIYRVMVLGQQPTQLPVYLPVEEQIVINAKTARDIGLSPPFKILQMAQLINRQELEIGDPLNISQAMAIAKQHNVSVAIQTESTEIARQDKNLAITKLLPQATTGIRHEQASRDVAVASGGAFPQITQTFSIGAQQILYDDPTVSNLRSALKTYEGEQFRLDLAGLDAMSVSGSRFINYLATRTLYKIELENLNLTRSNLQLAKLRTLVGAAGREEIFRWEAEEAQQKGSVVAREAEMNAALVALNQALGADQFIARVPENIELNDKDHFFLTGYVDKHLVENMQDYKRFQHFVVDTAYDESPEIKAFEQFLRAQNIQVGKAKRRFFIPSVTADINNSHALGQYTSGGSISPLAGAKRHQTLLGVQATYPLFEGAGRYYDIKREKARSRQLVQQLEQIHQLTQQRALNATIAIGSSYPNIEYSRQARESAYKNFELVRQKYAEGSVDIIRLLDAQSQAINRKREAAVAVYRYLNDIIELQRAMSWFETDKPSDQRQAFANKLQQYVSQPPDNPAKGNTHANPTP